MAHNRGRCGRCAACLNPRAKKACLKLRQQRASMGKWVTCGKCISCRNPQRKERCLDRRLVPVGPGRGNYPRKTRIRKKEKRLEEAVEEERDQDEPQHMQEEGDEDDWEQLDKGESPGPEDDQQQPPGGQQQQRRQRQPAPASSGLQLTPSGTRRFRDDAHRTLFTHNYERARRQHMSNLVFLLRHYAATRDWSRLAGVVATLMASDRAVNLSEQWMFRHPASRARLAEAMGAGWLLLQRQPVALSYEQTRKFLKQWAAYQLVPAGQEAVQLELARYSRAQGHATDAWDFLETLQFTTASTEGQRRALMASIRVDAWAETMRGAAELVPTPAPASASPNKRRRGRPARAAGWQPWQYDAQVWARGGRMAKELHQDAIDCCKGALEQQPQAGHVAQLQAQLQLAAGDAKGALATARQQRQQAPLDADAAGLLALLLVAHPAQQSQQQLLLAAHEQQSADIISPEAAAEAADCCCQLLAADPSCHAVAAALLALQDQQRLPAGALAAGCCYYLEAQRPSWQPPLLELRVWQHLAASLIQAATAVVDQQQRVQEVQQQRLPLLPRTLREVQKQRQQRVQQEEHGVASGSRVQRQQRRWQRLRELNGAVIEAQQQLERLLAEYQQCCSLMEGRLWWRDAHLLPQPATTVAAAVQAGAADPAALLAMAAVNAFLHPLWRRQVADNWRGSGGAAGLPRLLQNLMTRHTAAALEQTGRCQEAAALRAAVRLCRKAAAAAASVAQGAAGTVAALASMARQRADFWRAARRAWQPPAGWLPIPQGSTHPELGHVAALPHQWWACFPQHRRQQQPAQQQHPAQQQQLGSALAPPAGFLPLLAAGAAMHPAASPAATLAAGGSLAAQGTPESAAVAAGPASQQAEQHPGMHQQQQQQALRRVQQSSVRSILKGSQQQQHEQHEQALLWASQQEQQQQHSQQQQVGWDASQPALAAVLFGSDPTSATRGGRRVQFQLPPSPTASRQREQQPGQLAGQQQQSQQMHGGLAGGPPAHMQQDGSSQEQQHASVAAAAAAEQPAGGRLRQRSSQGRRRLLPQLPPSLAAEDEDAGFKAAAGGAAWRQRLQQRRQQQQQQQ